MKRNTKKTRYLMGSPFEITISGQNNLAENAVEAAFQEVARIERLFTIYQKDAPLARFNQRSEMGTTALDSEILKIIAEALYFSKLSSGAFDPTAGRLIDLWGFGPAGEVASPPKKEAVAAALQSVGYPFLKIDTKRGTLERLKDCLQLNLGGIVKGYAIDRAISRLKEHHISRALVSCGSTLYAFGKPGWQILIQDPRNESAAIDTLTLHNQALATSGDYERCFFYAGKRFSHLIDPRSGDPVSGMASVSVVAESAMKADVFSTAAFVLKSEKGKCFLEHQSGVEGLMLSEDQAGALLKDQTEGWGDFSNSSAMPRRHFLQMASAFALGMILPGGMIFPQESEAATRFSTESEALQRIFPEAETFENDQIILSDAQLSAAQQLAGKGFRKNKYRFSIPKKGSDTLGYALQLNVVGKERPITFLVGIDAGGQVRGVEVLIYRESKGSGVRYPRFMKQFKDKTTGDPLRLGRDIRAISGATLSSRSTAYAVRKALALVEVTYQHKGAE